MPDFSFFNQLENKDKSWIITSSWAAQWLKKYHAEIGFKSSDNVFCISEKQAGILSEITFKILISKEKNAKSVAELVNENGKGKTVVYLKGDKSLNVFQIENNFNIQLFETEVYRNLPVVQKVDADFDAYLFFSPSGIENFIEAGNSTSQSAQIFTIGKTTGNSAKQFFTNQVYESPVQDEFGFIEFTANRLKILQPKNIH